MQIIARGGKAIYGARLGIVVLKAAAGLLDDFLAAAADLVRDGAEAITTNCGFLSLFQTELAAHVRVPVATSALIQVPWVQAMLPPGQRVGIITVSAGSLMPRHLGPVWHPTHRSSAPRMGASSSAC